MKIKETVRIRMLGNAFEFQTGKEYDVPMDRANQLSGMGYAVIVEVAAPPAKEDSHVI